jgi:hypothetical protein
MYSSSLAGCAATGRHFSPALSIYKLEENAISSIVVGRVTGITMWVGVAGLALGQISHYDLFHAAQAVAVRPHHSLL